MGRRLLLQSRLESLTEAVQKVYFQEPTNVAMKYPCIVYDLDEVETSYADNKPYRRDKRWKITVIDEDPDSDIWELVAALPMCEFDRKYKADNLHHFVLNLFF